MSIYTVRIRCLLLETWLTEKGLHPEEAVQYLMDALAQQEKSVTKRPLYAICGTGHHSKAGRDKVGKALKTYLTDWRYAFREFSVPGDRNGTGGILGIEPGSWDRALATEGPSSEADSGIGLVSGMDDTKVRVVSAGMVGDRGGKR